MTTVPFVQNAMRRASNEIRENELTAKEKLEVWEHFQNKCAYCKADLSARSRGGHMDHLKNNGHNCVANRVLSCSECNSDEKRDSDWERFFGTKAEGADFVARKKNIQNWLKMHPFDKLPSSAAITKLSADLEEVVLEYGAKCDELRQAVAQTG